VAVRVCDLGLARVVGFETMTQTSLGGTPAYAAPELRVSLNKVT